LISNAVACEFVTELEFIYTTIVMIKSSETRTRLTRQIKQKDEAPSAASSLSQKEAVGTCP